MLDKQENQEESLDDLEEILRQFEDEVWLEELAEELGEGTTKEQAHEHVCKDFRCFHERLKNGFFLLFREFDLA